MTFECVKGPAARDTRLSIRVPRSLKKNIERRAAKEGKTIADTVISIAMSHVSGRNIPLAWWFDEPTRVGQGALTCELVTKRYSLWIVDANDSVTPLEYHDLPDDPIGRSKYIDHAVNPRCVERYLEEHRDVLMPQIALEMIYGQWALESEK